MIHVYHQKMGDMWCGVILENERIWATMYARTERDCVQGLLNSLPYNQPFTLEEKLDLQADKVLAAMKSLLVGEDVSWDFSFEWNHLSKYSQKVLGCLAKVPVGYVTTYKALARTVGGGPRAVGQIMASNPFAPLVPCHRVIAADFSIGGFGGAAHNTELKRAMLRVEDRGFDKSSRVKTECGLLELFPVGFLKKN